MIEIKDIKSVKIVPYTLMNSSITAVIGLIYGIVFAVIFGLTVGSSLPGITAGMIATVVIGSILAFPTVMFLISVLESFLVALLYNQLVPRVGAIQLGFEDLKEIQTVPVVPFALMNASIGGILTFLTMLIFAPLFAFGIQSAALAGAGGIPGLSSIGSFGLVWMIIMIVGIPIVAFIGIFIAMAIGAIIYNLLAPKIGGVELNFSSALGNFFEIESIPVVKFALILTLVLTVIQLILGIIDLIISLATGSSAVGALIGLVIRVVSNLIISFVLFAVMAYMYNYLRPKIGGIKLEIE
jgi:hypothetical protein